MAKIRSEEVVAAALALLDDVGLDDFTMRQLAQRLGVESPTLYWHFENKAALLGAMVEAVMREHHAVAIPQETARWPEWFAANARSLRRALLARRDGAKLHAGSAPGGDELARVVAKVAYLVRAGLPEREALMTLLAVGQFTLGCVMEEQARSERPAPQGPPAGHTRLESSIEAAIAEVVKVGGPGGEVAFEFGLGLILDGLRHRTKKRVPESTLTKKPRRPQPKLKSGRGGRNQRR